MARRNRKLAQRVRDGGEGERGDEEAETDHADRGSEAASHRPATAAHLGAEVERQARADEQERGSADAAADWVEARLAREANRDVPERDASQHEHEHELREADHQHRDERQADRSEHEEHDRERKNELEHPAIGMDPGEDGRQQVVDDEGDRVRQIEEVGERPDPAVDESGPPPRGRLDERGQASR